MALTATITKFSIEKRPGVNDFTATINVEVKDEAAIVLFDKNYSERYNSSTSLNSIKQSLQDKFVKDWDEYKSEKAIFDAATFDALVSDLQSAANTYINQ